MNDVCFEWFGTVTEKQKEKNDQIDEYKIRATPRFNMHKWKEQVI